MPRLLTAALLALTLAASSAALAGSPALAVDFDQVANRLEDAAARVPHQPPAADMVAEAALLRLGLGQVDRAEALAATLERDHGEAHPDLVAHVTLARARRHAGLHEWGALRDLLARATFLERAAVSTDDRLEAYALLGRAFDRLGRTTEAAIRHARVLALASRVAGPRGADAVGEARFFFAEQEHDRADAVVLPPHAGKPTRASIPAYINGPVVRWIESKLYAIQVAERAYFLALDIEVPRPTPPRPPPPPPAHGVIGLLNSGAGGDPDAPTAPWGVDTEDPLDPSAARPVPSPRWAVAALARIASLWADFVQQWRSLPSPFPPSSPRDDLGGMYLSSVLESPSEAHKQHARRACQAAKRLALQHHIGGEHTASCDAWLSRNYGAEHHTLEELLPGIAPARAVTTFAPATLFAR